MNQQPLISVCIATNNRPQRLRACVESILRGSYDRYEILIADQSADTLTKTAINEFRNKHIRYFHYSKIGKSNALNSLRTEAKGQIYVYTDDDCIASSAWLSSLARIYRLQPKVDGVLGRVEPYTPVRHTKEKCPSLFQKKTRSIITNRHDIHYKTIGMGNNMSYRKFVVHQSGPFFPWLGPGAPLGFTGGDESEYIYRVLRNGHSLLYDPSVLIYHDRWMSEEDEERLQARYSRGLYAFWFYYVYSEIDIPLLLNIGLRIKERFMPRLITTLRHVYKRRLSRFRLDMEYLWSDSVSFWIGFAVGTYRAAQQLITK